MSDHWTPPDRSWPTKDEVREVIRVIIDNIARTPDWAPKPKAEHKITPPDESWPKWRGGGWFVGPT